MRFFYTIFLFAMTCLIAVTGYSQQIASSKAADVQLSKRAGATFSTLAEALAKLEKDYDVHIVYDDAVVRGKTATYLASTTASFQQALESVLGGNSLTYNKVGARTIVLAPEPPEPAAPVPVAGGTIKGKVTDEQGNAMPLAQVFLQGTTIGDVTDDDGLYEIDDVPPGSYTLVASVIGFVSGKADISVAEGSMINQDFALTLDILNMEEVVTTGSRNPQVKLESSVAITTINVEQIRERAPRNTADLLKAIPGFYVESSGGEGGNNLFARGIPADGSFRYVQMQEDGLPVFEDGELMFANADLLMRVDETVEVMEGVRGGTSSIFASNAPGGIINFISKTGGSQLGGLVKTSVGDYGSFRTDIDYGGPLGENWRFNIGGFYRYDNGIRDPGFAANRGGQVKGNLTRFFKNGFLRFNFKRLEDRNIFYLPVPLQNKDNPEEIPGFDANTGTLTTIDANELRAPMPGGGTFNKFLDDGMHPKITAFGSQLSYDFGDGWNLTNTFRNTVVDLEFNAIFSLSDPVFADRFIQDNMPAGATNPVLSYAHSGEVISNPLTLNGNGLVVETGWWAVNMDMRNFADHAQLTKQIEDHSLTLGGYFSDYNADSFWYWHNVLSEVKDAPRLLDLDVTDSEGNPLPVTFNGFSRFGTVYNNFNIQTIVAAGYLNDEWQSTDNLRIDGGIRVEHQQSRGTVEDSDTFDIRDDFGTRSLALSNVSFGTGNFKTFSLDWTEVALTLGGNYTLNPNLAFYARGSKGFRMPDDNQIFFNLGSQADREKIEVEDIYQVEGGVKYSSPNLAVFGALFFNTFDNLPFSDEVVDPVTGEVTTSTRFAGSRTIGLELEAIARYEGFRVDFTGTLQDAEYQDFGANTGNSVRRIPDVYFTLTPSYAYDRFKVYGSWRYFDDRFTDDANTGVLPSFSEFSAGASYRITNRLILNVTGANLSNEIGLTEGNPRVDSQKDPRNFFFMARPILGRSFNFALTYKL